MYFGRFFFVDGTLKSPFIKKNLISLHFCEIYLHQMSDNEGFFCKFMIYSLALNCYDSR